MRPSCAQAAGRVRGDHRAARPLVLVALLTVPLAGGHLGRLLDVKLRGFPILIGALVIQVLVITVFPEPL